MPHRRTKTYGRVDPAPSRQEEPMTQTMTTTTTSRSTSMFMWAARILLGLSGVAGVYGSVYFSFFATPAQGGVVTAFDWFLAAWALLAALGSVAVAVLLGRGRCALRPGRGVVGAGPHRVRRDQALRLPGERGARLLRRRRRHPVAAVAWDPAPSPRPERSTAGPAQAESLQSLRSRLSQPPWQTAPPMGCNPWAVRFTKGPW